MNFSRGSKGIANIDAILNEMSSPAQLAPVNFMNWLLVIEEVSMGTR